MNLEMIHKDTEKNITVDLSKVNSQQARKIIQDQEVLGYRVVNIAQMMDALGQLDTIKIGQDVEDEPYREFPND